MSPHISIKGEIITRLFGFPITNSFIITTLVVILFSFIAIYYHSEMNKKKRSVFFYALHSIFVGMYGLFESVLKNKVTTFYALLGSFFFYILLANWSGLVPGVGSILIKPNIHKESVIEHAEKIDKKNVVEEKQIDKTHLNTKDEKNHENEKKHLIPLFRGGTADLNTTVALALVSVFMTQFYGFKFLGPIKHLKKYFDFRKPIMIMLGPLEIVQEFARIISFGFRLYGNIFAGEVLLTIIPFLLPMFFAFVVAPLFLMEIFVGLVQAMVFVMLSAVFINMATSENH